MENTLKQKYKVEKNNIEKEYEYQLALKNNKEYEQKVDNVFLKLISLLQTIYPKIKIEPPIEREKSKYSIKNKIKNLEIERLCKLYAIGQISKEEKTDLDTLIQSSVSKEQKEIVQKILFEPIEDLKEIDSIMQDKEVTDHIKTALLRISKVKLKEENKESIQKQLEEKYGKIAAENSNQLKDNLLHWECIEQLGEEGIKKLHNPSKYLKIKDLRGIEIIIVDVPENIETDNTELKMAIENRKNAPKEQKSQNTDLCCIAIAKDFANKLMNTEEYLKALNISVLKDGYKHKEKQNGYLAEHIKFCFRDHPEYIFELQLHSIYRSDLSKPNGAAAHDKRSGKKRVFPSIENKKDFIEKIQDITPKYTILKRNYQENRYYIHKCSMPENIVQYFLGYTSFNMEDYPKINEYWQER